MMIKWLGHSCFKLKNSEGKVVVTDPFDEKVGYPVPSVRADIVTMSHGHSDHSNLSAILGEPVVIREAGAHEALGIHITGIETEHDDIGGARRGKNMIFVIEMDGIRICHLGDLGHVLSPEQIAQIGRVHVLLVPVGGNYTIDAKTAAEVCESLNPNTVIPMHYKLDTVVYPIETVHPFLDIMKQLWDVSSIGDNKIEVDVNKAKKRQRVIVLNYY